MWMELKLLTLNSECSYSLPQMSPMNWIALFGLFTFSLILVVTKLR